MTELTSVPIEYSLSTEIPLPEPTPLADLPTVPNDAGAGYGELAEELVGEAEQRGEVEPIGVRDDGAIRYVRH